MSDSMTDPTKPVQPNPRPLLGWHTLEGDYTVHVARTRRSGKTLRFIVLGPFGPGQRLRPLVAAGDLVDGGPVVDHGALSVEQLEAIAALVAELTC